MHRLSFFNCLLLSLLLLLSCNAKSIIPREKIAGPVGRFGIIRDKLDHPDGKPYWNHYSGYVKYVKDQNGEDVDLNNRDKFSDRMLLGAVLEAFNDMQSLGTNQKDDLLPKAMSVLEVHGELFFSSSLRAGSNSFAAVFSNSCVKSPLGRCSVAASERGPDPESRKNGEEHQRGGNCGEVGAIHLYCKTHQIKKLEDDKLPLGARIVTVGQEGKKGEEKTVLKPACDAARPPKWGCRKLLKQTTLNELPENTESTAVPSNWKIQYDENAACL